MHITTKAKKYLKENGSKAFLSRVKMHFAFVKSKEYVNKNGIYVLKSKNKYVYPKSNDIFVLSNNIYKESKLKDQINELNNNGYSVHYYHTKEDKNIYESILPIVENKKVSQDDMKKIRNKTVILEGKIKVDKSNTIYKNKNNKFLSKFNNKNIISKCIEALIKYNKYEYEIIVIDNCSKDGSYELLEKEYKKKIKLYKNVKNGCSSGRNLAIKKTNKDYLLFLDSDQIVENINWLDNYLKIINDKNTVGWAAGWFNKKGFAGQIVDNYELRCMPPGILYRTDIGYLGSGGLFVSRKIIEETEGFDENYDPTGYEDTDISLQIRNLGYELVYCPYLGLKHEAHQTTSNVLNDEKINKNANYFKNKWNEKNKKLLRYIR